MIPPVQNDPDYLLSLPQFPRVTLACRTASGGKYWLGVAMETGLSIRYGKLNTQGTVHHIPLSQCKAGNPVLELKRRFLSKVSKGYVIVPHETQIP